MIRYYGRASSSILFCLFFFTNVAKKKKKKRNLVMDSILLAYFAKPGIPFMSNAFFGMFLFGTPMPGT